MTFRSTDPTTPVTGLTVPPELQRSLPRDVVLSGNGIAVVVIALALVAGSIALATTLYVKGKRETQQFAADRADAVSTTALVTDARRIPGKEDRWRVDYSYTVGYEHFTATSRMTRHAAKQMPSGTQVPIMYVRSNPERSWIVGHEPNEIPPWLPFVVGASMLLPGVIIFFSIRRQRTLLERGRPAIARVTQARRFRGTHNRSSVRVNYEFTTLDGAAVKSRSMTNKRGVPAVGSEVVIVYDADNPKRTALYPLDTVKVRQE